MLIALAVIAPLAIALATGMYFSQTGAKERAEWWKECAIERGERVRFLERTLDEIRARELHTSPPPEVTPARVETELPKELEKALAQFEDDSGELAELVRHRLAQGADSDSIVRELEGGAV